MTQASFRRFGGACAVLLAVCGVLYAGILVLESQAPDLADRVGEILAARGLNRTASLLLAAMGFLTTIGVAALHDRLSDAPRGWLAWATGLGLIGGAMTAAHGWWDVVRVPVLLAQWASGQPARQVAIATFAGVPNPVDPRGLGALLFVGVFVLVVGGIVWTGRSLPVLVGQVGLIYGILLVVSFLAGVLGPETVRAGLTGLAVGVVGPVWWLLVGRALWRVA